MKCPPRLLLFAALTFLSLVESASSQVMTGPNKLSKTLRGITFSSNYDNGSLKDIVAGSSANAYTATLYSDTGEKGSSKYWFRFKLSNVAGRTVELSLDHTENPRPAIRVGNGSWRRMTATEAPSTTSLVLNFTSGESEAEIAFFEPLSVGEIAAAVQKRVQPWAFASQRTIGFSHEGRAIEMVEIEDPFYPRSAKHRVWVHSRVHAGEVTASHSMLGILDQVLAATEAGRQLREHCLFTIVPVVNVDGVARGHTRWDAQGIDQESEWCAIRVPEVAALKTQVDQFMGSQQPIEVALNLHSTRGNYADSFFFKHLSPSVSDEFEIIQQRYIDAVNSTSALFNNASAQTSQLNACTFIESYFWNNWGASVMALTHEGHYYRRQTDNDWITGSDYREIGSALARGVVGYFNLPAATEKDLTYQAWASSTFAGVSQLTTQQKGELADPDDDGQPNIVEYALGTSPMSGSHAFSPIDLRRESSEWVASIDISALPTDLAVNLEFSSNLSGWTPVTTAQLSRSYGRRPDGLAVTRLRASLPTASPGAGQFVRLVVEKAL